MSAAWGTPEDCRVCMARRSLVRKRDRLAKLSHSYTDQAMAGEMRDEVMRQTERIERVVCIHHDEEAA